jgi:adenylosuccinate synthase
MSNTVGVTHFADLPKNARRYVERLTELMGVPMLMVSTGPDRKQTIELGKVFSE